jgi:hypothetical protein
MPDAAHAGACVAARHYLCAAAVTERTDRPGNAPYTGLLLRSFRSRAPRGRLAIELPLLRVKATQVRRSEWDHYEQIGVVAAADIDRTVNRTDCSPGL